MATIGLVLIAKDEAHVIERALNSALPLIDYLMFVDTGSTDETQAIVANWIDKHHMASQMIEEKWKDFAYNRTHALRALRSAINTDYALLLDADDTIRLDAEPDAIKESLTADCYNINMINRTIIYQLPRIVSNHKPFIFRGPVHEFLDCEEKPYTQEFLPTVSQVVIGGGARSQNPDKYRHDAELLKDYLETETDPFMRQRYTFYLAQSWRDCGEDLQAYIAYRERARMSGWHEEVYLSLLYSARLSNIDNSITNLETYKQAIAINPKRAEAIHDAARLCRLNHLYSEGFSIAKQGVRLPLWRGLFAESWIYAYGLLDEFSLCAYYTGRYVESWLACQMILRGDGLNDTTRKRIEENAAFALQR